MHTHNPVEVSRHKCLIYDGHPSQQLPVVVPLLKDGLHSNWRCLYLGSPEMVNMVGGALRAEGVDTSKESTRPALLLSSDRDHLAEGTFEPRKMIDALCKLIDDAVREGYQGLCATGDMKWELGASQNFDRLLEYEAMLEQVFRERPLRGICQYHRKLVPASAVRDALITHQSAYIGEVLNQDNLFYIPPELLLEKSDSQLDSKQGEWMCQQIIRVLNAENSRDKALTALKSSEMHQRRLAEQLAEANRSLEQRVKERTAELEVANRHLEEFSYSVSHDLRAPLRSIKGFSEILTEEFGDALGEEGRQHLQRVIASTRHMDELIEGLLQLGRVIKTEVVPAPIDVTALAEKIAMELRESDPSRSVEFTIRRGMRATGDLVLLRAAFTNLLGNSWKFTAKRSNPRIEIGSTNQAGQTIFHVRDNGAGFEMKYAGRLFGTFQRLHTQEEFPGTGVGLATVQKIIARHGGKIWAESSPGNGASFYFTLSSEVPTDAKKYAN